MSPAKGSLSLVGADLIDSVFAHLTQPEFYTLCLVNRETKVLAEPYLYSTLQWLWDEEHFPPIVAFLRTILSRPALASWVIKVDLQGSWTNTMWTGRAEHPEVGLPLMDSCFSEAHLRSGDLAQFQRAVDRITSLDSSFANEWKSALARRHMDAYITLLISRLHHLREFQIDGNFVQDTKLMSAMFRLALINKVADLPSFENLKEVRHAALFSQRDYNGKHTRERMPYFHLPNLETLLVGLDKPTDQKWLSDVPMMPTLRNLRLTQCRESRLRELLPLTPMLVSFSWEFFWFWQGTNSERYDPPTLDFNVLRGALSPFFGSLRSLILDARWIWSPFNDYQDFRRKGDLLWIKSFVHLRELAFDIILLTSTMASYPHSAQDLLPASLRTLTMLHDVAVTNYNYHYSDSGYLVECVVNYFEDLPANHPELDASLTITDFESFMDLEERTDIEAVAERSTFGIKLMKFKDCNPVT